MQQRENTIYNTAWYSSKDNKQGPTTILDKLEMATKSWDNVIDQSYIMGTTLFGKTSNAFSGCNAYNQCNQNKYVLERIKAKARMITLQEVANLNCTTSNKSCPNWVNNYLFYSTSSGGTKNDNYAEDGKSRNYGYWTMSAFTEGSYRAWNIRNYGLVTTSDVTYTNSGARAVVVISK